MGLCNTKHMGHLFKICLVEGRIMTFPLIRACFILYSLHMWTYQRPKAHRNMLHSMTRGSTGRQQEGILYVVYICVCLSPDNIVSLLASSTGKTPSTPLRSARHLRICVIICLSACVNVQEIPPHSHVYSAQRLGDRDLSAVLITLPSLPPLILQRPQAP